MSNVAFETLVKNYYSSFTETWVTNLHHYTPAFVIFQGDTLHQNTIDDSNVECIHGELIERFPHGVHKKTRPYVEEVFVHVADLESNEELAEHVLAILEALDDYPIFNDEHYHQLENDRLVEYMHDGFVFDLACELDKEVEEVEQWVKDNQQAIWDHFDGSVDDVPFNIEEIAALIS